jgi:hypothetical protein
LQSQTHSTSFTGEPGHHVALIVQIREPAVRVLAVTDDGDHSWSQHWAGYGEELWVTQLLIPGIRLTVTLDAPSEAQLSTSLIDPQSLRPEEY